MHHSKLFHRRLCFQQFNWFTLAALLLLFSTSVTVAEAPIRVDKSLISDAERPTQGWVAREILEIQQRLGGSIVSGRQSLRDIAPLSAADHAEVTDFPEALVQFSSDFLADQSAAKTFSPAEKTVESLRDAAWQLDQSAEKLERSDLYKQADALRDLAQQFRLDARTFRAQTNE